MYFSNVVTCSPSYMKAPTKTQNEDWKRRESGQQTRKSGLGGITCWGECILIVRLANCLESYFEMCSYHLSESQNPYRRRSRASYRSGFRHSGCLYTAVCQNLTCMQEQVHRSERKAVYIWIPAPARMLTFVHAAAASTSRGRVCAAQGRFGRNKCSLHREWMSMPRAEAVNHRLCTGAPFPLPF